MILQMFQFKIIIIVNVLVSLKSVSAVVQCMSHLNKHGSRILPKMGKTW